ncbi:hypothetical protein BEP19_05735 [Ammoniphilus oxalaticus]|uniref:Post-transcriptional regulator n=1 Tax=Ammoniphilus oxalaticus TaxID=66863 RepID=A0A419SIZ9_9BACL|nr:post-transcriptional regulator [Ammoniphilus oxalaticus]RKD23926.1 hypothetical protein BEP19_05735 [Ammoniphilus oxalaticus]
MAQVERSLEELEREMGAICQSKAEEFHLLGYEQVSADEIWECVSTNYAQEVPPLHKVVNDILSLTVTKFMNWMMMKMYRGEI